MSDQGPATGGAEGRREAIRARLDDIQRDPDRWTVDELLELFDDWARVDCEFFSHSIEDVEWLLAECDRLALALEVQDAARSRDDGTRGPLPRTC